MEEKYLTYERRGYIVTQHNDFIRKARFNLTLLEQKVFLYLVSRIRPDDDDFQWYEFTIDELCKVFGFTGTGNYNRLKAALKSLSDKSFYMVDGFGAETLVRWLSKIKLFPRSGVIHVKLDEDLKPYLLGLKKNFTPYQLENVLVMRSTHCILIYELLLSYSRSDEQRELKISVDELKSFLQVSENYGEWKDFRRWVLLPALQQINTYTDLQVTMEPVRRGRFIRELKFTLLRDEDTVRKWERATRREKALDGTGGNEK